MEKFEDCLKVGRKGCDGRKYYCGGLEEEEDSPIVGVYLCFNKDSIFLV